MRTFDAIVLAGGQSRRLDGVDKATLVVDGMTLLDRALAAVSNAERLIVVGPARPTLAPVTWTREEPAGGGPVAAIAAALPLVSADVTVLLACDLPTIDAGSVSVLVQSLTADAAVPVDGTRRRQPLAAAYETQALRAALAQLAGGPAGASMRALLEPMNIVELELPTAAWRDIDTWDDLTSTRTEMET